MYHLVAATKQRSILANMNTIQVNTKELMRLHSGCHGNLVAVAMLVYIVTRKFHAKYELKATYDKGVIEVLLWLPQQPSYHSNEVCG